MYQVIKDNTTFYPGGTILYLKDGYYLSDNKNICPFLTKEFVERMPNVFRKIK